MTKAENLVFSDHTMTADLSDGRTISVPLAWFPRPFRGSREEGANWRFIGKGQGMHWKDLDDVDSDGNICAITGEHASKRADLRHFSYEQVAT